MRLFIVQALLAAAAAAAPIGDRELERRHSPYAHIGTLADARLRGSWYGSVAGRTTLVAPTDGRVAAEASPSETSLKLPGGRRVPRARTA
eukprot:CAMPEP_0119274850 /NCGR_PEP_ID=MMETSP1329-20130426/12795_1 /TAXON_ID=114041 /ORGANISM="Genus nov. species nov., Strain RCC1024" /LENGTH=89 /DNA_ID=CAMNT_0007275197 /DNA_START=163 /DNA_END=432 /DNA_ORIENTATION=+